VEAVERMETRGMTDRLEQVEAAERRRERVKEEVDMASLEQDHEAMMTVPSSE
jgi:hypothetical protein